MTSSPSSKTDPDLEIQALDALFEHAGLKRGLRGKAAGVTRRMRMEREEAEELTPATPVPRVAANGVEWVPAPGWERMKWLWQGFSTRRGGVSRAYCAEEAKGELNLGFTAEDEPQAVEQNRRLLAEAISGDAATPLITLRQIHSNLLVVASASDARRERPWKGDGIMTDEPGLLLGIQTADCIPVLVADRKRHAVAAFHAGWRGTVKRIVETGIGRMRLEFGSRPEDLVAAIGPGVATCCYAVGEDVFSAFESQFSYSRELFREVYDSDPREIPHALPDPARAGALADWPQFAPEPGGGQPPAAAGRRAEARVNPNSRRLHELPQGAVLLLPRRAGAHRAHVERNRRVALTTALRSLLPAFTPPPASSPEPPWPSA